MELISKEKLLNELQTLYPPDPNKDEFEQGVAVGVGRADDLIELFPAEDVVSRKHLNCAIRSVRDRAIDAIKQIRLAIWGFDIPSPTIPEYVEHHMQMQELMKQCDELIDEMRHKDEHN